MPQSMNPKVIYGAIAGGLALIIFLVIYFLIFDRDRLIESVEVDKDFGLANSTVVKGSALISAIESNHGTKGVLIKGEKDAQFGIEFEYEEERSNACGYESYAVKDKGTFADKVHLIRNPNTEYYINPGVDYKVYHMCQNKGEVIGIAITKE